MPITMEHFIFSSSGRQLRRIAQYAKPSLFAPSMSAAQGIPRSYAIFPICQACRDTARKSRVPTESSRRWVSEAATASTTSRTEALRLTPKTHYEFFPQTLPQGPPPAGSFVIDTRQLRNEFLQLQAVAHPDRHPQEVKQRAEATSARINEAYKTLQHPLLRAQYLLSLRGIDVAEDETAKVEDLDLLTEILEIREEIESAQEEEDLHELKILNDKRIQESERILGDAFRRDDLGRATEEAVRLRYWVNIKDSLDAWEKGKPVVLQH